MDALIRKPAETAPETRPEAPARPSRAEAERAVRTLIAWAGDDPDREGLLDTRHIDEAGGLSGAPLMAGATTTLRMMRTRLPDHIPMIGVGGIMEGADAATKQAAGAVLVQTYTGLVYRGPALIGECVEALRRRKEARSGALPLE